MPLVPERVFDPSKPLIARRPFQGGGRHFKAGDRVDPRVLLMTPRRARQMFDAGTLCHPNETTESGHYDSVADDLSPPADQSTAPSQDTAEVPQTTPAKQESAGEQTTTETKAKK